METTYCQSCGMPMTKPEEHGLNADGTTNADYCTYCYQNGAFTQDMTMEEMIENCLQFLSEAHPELTEEQARAQMQEFFPKLKRWQK